MNPIVNFVIFLFYALPTFLRVEPLTSYIEVFSRVLNSLNQMFVYKISHTGQVASLEHYLNDKYGIAYSLSTRAADIASESIIWIGDGMGGTKAYLYNKMEMKPPKYLYNNSESMLPLYLRNNSEAPGYEFVVYVPSTLTYNEQQLRARIAEYKIAGPRYTIQIY